MKTSGIEAWERRLQGIEERALQSAQDGMEEALRAMAAVLADYPPEVPDQRYIRTYALRDGWNDAEPAFATEGNGLSATLTNPVAHGPYVEGEDQAAVHQGRWPTVATVQDEQADRARAVINAAVQAGVKRG